MKACHTVTMVYLLWIPADLQQHDVLVQDVLHLQIVQPLVKPFC